MARYDIIINPIYGEVSMKEKPTDRYINKIQLLDNQNGLDNDHFCYLEAVVPINQGLSYNLNDSMLVQFKYIAIAKPAFIRFILGNLNEEKNEYLINKKNNSTWFPIIVNDNGYITQPLLCSWSTINDAFFFEMVFSDEGVSLFSGFSTDLVINASKKQNEDLLLLTRKGNLYQHIITGVGIMDYINSNLANSGLADKLQTEFLNDGMIIIEAAINPETGQLKLKTEE